MNSFFNQLWKKKTHFLDSMEKSHEVTWKSPRLEQFLDRLKNHAMTEKVFFTEGPSRKRNFKKACCILKDDRETLQATF